jgi:hypothetical protein
MMSCAVSRMVTVKNSDDGLTLHFLPVLIFDQQYDCKKAFASVGLCLSDVVTRQACNNPFGSPLMLLIVHNAAWLTGCLRYILLRQLGRAAQTLPAQLQAPSSLHPCEACTTQR